MLLKLRKWICQLFKKLPVFSALTSYESSCHKQALPKFFWLWTLSSLPLFFAISFSKNKMEEGALNISDLIENIKPLLSASEIYVYIASFLAPLFYLFYERFKEAETATGTTFWTRDKFLFRHIFPGYWLIFLVSIVCILLMIFAFVVKKVDASWANHSNIYIWAEYLTPYCYVFSLLCWYLTILDGFKEKNSADYVNEQRNIENNFVNDFSKRISGDGE